MVMAEDNIRLDFLDVFFLGALSAFKGKVVKQSDGRNDGGERVPIQMCNT